MTTPDPDQELVEAAAEIQSITAERDALTARNLTPKVSTTRPARWCGTGRLWQHAHYSKDRSHDRDA